MVIVPQNKIDIGVLVGGSSPETFAKMKELTKNIVGKYNMVNDKIRFGVVEYSQGATIVKPLSKTTNKLKLLQLIDDLTHKRGRNDLFEGIKYTQSKFFSTCSETAPCKEPLKSVVIFTDKEPDQATKELLNKLVDSGVKVLFSFISPEDRNPSDLGLDNDKIDVQIVKTTDDSDDKVDDIIYLVNSGNCDSDDYCYILKQNKIRTDCLFV